MGSATAPDPSAQSQALAQSAEQADLVATKSSLAGQTSSMAQTFGSNILTGPRGASLAGAGNGFSSIALAPLGSAK